MKKDLLKLQDNYFVASVENVKEANSAIGKAQGWVFTLGTAELALLGSIGDFSPCIVKVEITLILVAFFLFVMGSVFQYKHFVKTSRYYFSLSAKILKLVDENGTSEVEKIPSELLDTQALQTNNGANYLILSSFILIGLSTIFIWFNLIF